MLDSDAVPYFPCKVISEDNGWYFRNPIKGCEQELNEAAFWLLKLCDGFRTWGEIATELGRAYQMNSSMIEESSLPLLKNLIDEGALFIRRQRMDFWQLPPPLSVLWNLTDSCNLKCRHCAVSAGESGDEELSLDECYRVADEMVAFGVGDIILSGGEPLMRRDFFKIAEHIAKSGLSLQIATNATLITGSVAKRIADIEAQAQVSLDGATPIVHDDFRQVPGAWKRAVQGIQNLAEAGVPFIVAATLSKGNIGQIPAIYKLVSEMGASSFRILPFVPFGRGTSADNMEVPPEEILELIKSLRSEESEVPIMELEFECTLSPMSPEKYDPKKHVGCDGAIAYCTIVSNGDVLPCHFFSGVEADNVRDKSFAWIWENSQILNYFRSLTISDIHGACQECAWLSECRGGCIATGYVYGDIFESNRRCWTAKAFMQKKNIYKKEAPGSHIPQYTQASQHRQSRPITLSPG